MEEQDILARANKARTFIKEIDGYKFTLRVPTQHEVQIETVRNIAQGDTIENDFSLATLVGASRSLLERSIVGWFGPTLGDVLHDLTEEEAAEILPWSKKVVPLFLDEKPDIAKALTKELKERTNERDAKVEDVTKNSQSTSTGNST